MTGLTSVLLLLIIVLGPAIATITGALGIRRYARGGFVGHDQFTAMNLLVALGVGVLVLPEILASIITIVPSATSDVMVVMLLQFPGVILWTLGTMSYYSAAISALKRRSVRGDIATMIVVAAIVTVTPTWLSVDSPASRDVIRALAYFPTTTALGATVIALAALAWSFRGGRIGIFIIVLLAGMIVYLVQSLMWGALGILPTDIITRLLSVEAYVLLGLTQSIEETL